MMLMMTKIIWIAALFKRLIRSGMNFHTTEYMKCDALTECRYNQLHSSVLSSNAARACYFLFITHLPLCLQKYKDPGRGSKSQCSYCRKQCWAVIKPQQPYPESHDGTWSQVAVVQGCTHYIHLQRDG